jgi:hypothetical protein
MSVVTYSHHSIHPAKDHLIQAFLHHTDRSLNHLEFALSPFAEDYYASPVQGVINPLQISFRFACPTDMLVRGGEESAPRVQ